MWHSKWTNMQTKWIAGLTAVFFWVGALAESHAHNRAKSCSAEQVNAAQNYSSGRDTLIPGYDPLPPRVPLSTKPYYPGRAVPSTIDGYTISGGRFDEFDLVNIVYHSNSVRDSLGNLIRGNIGRADFFDLDNQLLGSFDILANNPYKPEQYSHFLAEGYMDVGHSVVDRRSLPDYDWRNDVTQYATSGGNYENRHCGTLCVAYYLEALDEDLTLLGFVATYILLDERGNELARLEDVEDVFFGQGLVTCDGKYFCLRYGGAFTEEFERMYNEHLRIYDIATKEIIYERELPPQMQFTQPTEIPGNLIWISQSLTGVAAAKQDKAQSDTSTYVAIDPKERICYLGPSDPALHFIRKFIDRGFIIENPKKRGEFKEILIENWQSEKF